jgi:hypothetical protein
MQFVNNRQDTDNLSTDLGSIFRLLTADQTGNNDANAQAILVGASAINLLARTYLFELFARITRAAGITSHTTSLLFAGTVTINTIDYIASVSNPTGNVLGGASEIMGNAATAVVVTAANTSATEDLRIWARGIIRVTTAGTLIPQFKYSAIPGGAPTIKRGAFITIRPQGSNTVTAVN